MTPTEAKRIIKTELERRALPFSKLSAKTVGFSDLARGSCIFVTVKDWPRSPFGGAGVHHEAFAEIKAVAKANGFCLE